MEKQGNWQIIALKDDEDGNLLYSIMVERPEGFDFSEYTENVSVYWTFADEGLPSTEMLKVLQAFEGLLDSLDKPGDNSFLAFVFSGRGKREWSYYAQNYDKFIEMLNDALASKPRFPIQIEHSHDPEWEYWNGIKEHIGATDC